jgi:hypothetical protein
VTSYHETWQGVVYVAQRLSLVACLEGTQGTCTAKIFFLFDEPNELLLQKVNRIFNRGMGFDTRLPCWKVSSTADVVFDRLLRQVVVFLVLVGC